MPTAEEYSRLGEWAHMYGPYTDIDRRKSHRTVPMEVVNASYSRTGTMTMQKAFEVLGYTNPYHTAFVYQNVRDCDLWLEAVKAKYFGIGPMPDKKFWDGLLGHCAAVNDAPGALFVKELIDCYPDAKVVLVERDVEKWFVSFKKTLLPQLQTYTGVGKIITDVLVGLDKDYMGRIFHMSMAMTQVMAGYPTTYDESVVRSRSAYRRHYLEARDIAPKDRLLNFRLEDGWEPLCRFLGKPVPDVPFPHVNEASVFERVGPESTQVMMRNIKRKLLRFFSVVGVPVLALLLCIRWFSLS